MNMIYQTNASKGMALMNEKNGREWVLDFDLESFDITLICTCVVGQHYGDYEEGLRDLFDMPDDTDLSEMTPDAIRHGFDGHSGADMPQLQAEWTALISDQKAELACTS